jgi:hypothetical protein
VQLARRVTVEELKMGVDGREGERQRLSHRKIFWDIPKAMGFVVVSQ